MPEKDAVKSLLTDLNRDERINGHHAQIEVELDDGTLTLTGDARHIAAKRRALALAEQHLGRGCRIVDKLRRDTTRRLGDLELAKLVGQRLTEEPVFAEYSVDVYDDGQRIAMHDAGGDAHVVRIATRDAMVHLEGTVGTLTHKRLAEVIAWWTGGCAAVLNELEVVPPEEDNDNELTDAIRMTLEKDPIVDASQIRIGTAAGVVHVQGLMLNDEQRNAVLEDVWLVPGVVDVVDRIETRQV